MRRNVPVRIEFDALPQDIALVSQHYLQRNTLDSGDETLPASPAKYILFKSDLRPSGVARCAIPLPCLALTFAYYLNLDEPLLGDDRHRSGELSDRRRRNQ